MTNLEILETWFRRVWSEEDEAAIEEMFVPDGRAVGLGEQTKGGKDEFREHEMLGPEEFKVFQRALLGLVKDVRIEIKRSITSGEWLCALCEFQGTSRRTGERVRMTGTVYGRFSDDQIIDAFNHFDFLSLFQQLGSLETGTFERCLNCRE
ncbi:ester cyclase [Roseibium sp. MMSF_3412]|uniref:ester cyclase n=1 Tax=Roseibium sp. MMSF_3412 TaxID=3046712 RepID=UPI00273FEEFA|nr:nuclear transport factor 2 family protein [Roseibium sp. MMSF_3412]